MNEEVGELIRAGLDGYKKTIDELHGLCNLFMVTCQKNGHNTIKRNDSTICEYCGKGFGWWCPKSENNICDYNQEDGTYDPDQCIYCGQPNERK